MGELAERSGVSRTVVSSLENGKGSAYPNAIAAISETLGFSPDFFELDLAMPDRDVLHYRRQTRVPAKAMERAQARAALFSYVASSFKRYARFERQIAAHGPIDGMDHIEEAAIKFRERLGIPTEAPLASCVNLAEGAGAFVGVFDAGDVPIDGFCWAADVQVILVRSEAPWSRQRFSLSHELGHLLLHGTQTSKSRQEIEVEANRFAGALLVPRAAFWREFPRPSEYRFDWASMFSMKARWGVSVQALIHRAFDLGIIREAQYRRANILISKFGWRRNEPGERARETPTVCSRFLAELSSRTSISAFARSLRVPLQSIEDLFSIQLDANREGSGCWRLPTLDNAARSSTPPSDSHPRLVPVD